MRWWSILFLCIAVGCASAVSNETQRYNQMQFVRAHNSYHMAPVQGLLDAAFQSPLLAPLIQGNTFLTGLINGSMYTMPSLSDLLTYHRVRSLELDFYADPNGKLFGYTLGNVLANLPYKSSNPVMSEPGFKVLHLDNIDYQATCLTMTLCLAEIKAWADDNPEHDPITLFLEFKDAGLVDLLNSSGNSDAVGLINSLLASAAAKSGGPDSLQSIVLPDDSLYSEVFNQVVTALGGPSVFVKPDDVRGSAATIADAITASVSPWPTLADMRGKFVVVVTGAGRQNVIDLYGPNLQGSPVWTKHFWAPNATIVPPDAAFVDFADFTDNFDQIKQYVEQGYVVEANADSETVQARANDTSRLQTLLASGCQIIITDFPDVLPTYFSSNYSVELPNNAVLRCNPVNAPAGCVDVVSNITAPLVSASPGNSSTPAAPTPPGSIDSPSTKSSAARQHAWAALLLFALSCLSFMEWA